MESKSFQKRPAKDDVIRIDRVELALLRLSYVHFFETSFGREYHRSFIIAKLYADGLCGFGEVVASEAPRCRISSFPTTSRPASL